jgi:tetratricopeptide (TPR) repeat protein
MAEQDEYKPSFFDRNGPEAAQKMVAYVYGGMVFIVMLALGSFLFGPSLAVLGFAAGGTALLVGFTLGLSRGAGAAYKRALVDGASTPYVEQYSYQQALVMQGKLDEALESFEAVIAEKPQAIDPRLKAAELYDRDKKNHGRAAELFREALRIETINAGQFVYVTNRLVDLYTGPLNEPGRALVELRKLIDRYPTSPAADQARAALATLKARHLESSS